MHHFGSHLFFIQLWRLVLIFPLPKNWEHEKCFTQGSFYVLSSLSHKLRQFLKLMPHYKIAPDWFSIFHICQVLQGLLLVKPCTWRKHCVSFSSLPTLHTKGFKNVLVLHIGLICKLKDIVIISIPSSCYGLAINKWRITRQDKFYWSINWCWSAEELFPRLSPFITLNHSSPKIS